MLQAATKKREEVYLFMNKKRIITMIFAVGTILSLFFIIQTSADSPVSAVQPGSVDDPMVTKSYLDQQLKQQVTAEVAAQIAKLPTGGSSGGAAGLTVVQLSPGQTLMAGAGSEFIVRNGSVVAVSLDPNGIPDVTSGKDIANKAAIGNNHLLIFPNDKRGIKPDAKQTSVVFVMVRGGYSLLNKDGTAVTP